MTPSRRITPHKAHLSTSAHCIIPPFHLPTTAESITDPVSAQLYTPSPPFFVLFLPDHDFPMTSFLRIASSAARPILRTSTQVPRVVVPTVASKASAIRFYSDSHEESFEEFTARYEKEFENVNDVFELQRNLNNAFAYDLVPSPSVIIAALKAARRVNDFPTAVRIFEGIKAKVENKQQYHQYLDELKDLREELGVSLVEDLYPENK